MKSITIFIFSFFFLDLAFAKNGEELCTYQKGQNLESLYANKSYAEKVQPVLSSFLDSFGKCLSVHHINDEKYEFTYEKATVPAKIYFNIEGKITGLWYDQPKFNNVTKESILEETSKLPGTVSLYISDISGEEILNLNSTKKLALGSTFKLYVLKELQRRIKNGNLKWSHVLKLKEEHKSLPSGMLHTWPNQSPITLHSLASLMISKSDNTATDLLIHFLGRENIENLSKENTPFLTTLEMFKLKGAISEDLAQKYINGDIKYKRKYLETLKNVSKDSVKIFTEPKYIDQIEWFSSTKEICSILFSLKDLEMLRINSGIASSSDYEVVGFKGGSEPGVLQLSTIVKTKKSKKWYCVSGTWNNPEKEVDEDQFVNLLSKSFSLIKE